MPLRKWRGGHSVVVMEVVATAVVITAVVIGGAHFGGGGHRGGHFGAMRTSVVVGATPSTT